MVEKVDLEPFEALKDVRLATKPQALYCEVLETLDGHTPPTHRIAIVDSPRFLNKKGCDMRAEMFAAAPAMMTELLEMRKRELWIVLCLDAAVEIAKEFHLSPDTTWVQEATRLLAEMKHSKPPSEWDKE